MNNASTFMLIFVCFVYDLVCWGKCSKRAGGVGGAEVCTHSLFYCMCSCFHPDLTHKYIKSVVQVERIGGRKCGCGSTCEKPVMLAAQLAG